jgi:hypothetical protein
VLNFSPELGPNGHWHYRMLRTILGGPVRRFLKDLDDPKAAQERQFRALLKGAQGTGFWSDHKLSSVKDLSDFRRAIPIRTGAEYQPYLDRVAAGEAGVLSSEKTRMLLETSGTTGTPKHLPVTDSWAETVQLAQRLWTLALVRDHPGLVGGKALTMVSPMVHARSPGGLAIGSNTGRIRAAQPFWLRRRYAVPAGAMEISCPIARQYAVLRFGIGADVRSITTANPSLLLLMFRRLEEWKQPLFEDLVAGTLRHGPAADIAPGVRTRLEGMLKAGTPPPDCHPLAMWNLESVNCWTGGPAAYFATKLRVQLPGVSVREVGVSASEGSFAFPLSATWPGSVLWTGGHVLEFVDSASNPVWAWELEPGMRVRLVVSTTAGLYRYDMADELEVVGRCLNTPLVRFVGKSGRYLNAVGERVTGSQVSAALAAVGADLEGFTVRVEMAETPMYVLAFEGKNVGNGLSEQFDLALSKENVEYEGKRRSGRLGPPRAEALGPGHYARYRAALVRAGAPAGQVKDPVIAVDESEWKAVQQAGESA